jgi:hypothetical protein
MSPTSCAGTTVASPRARGTGDPLPLDSRGARRVAGVGTVPRLYTARGAGDPLVVRAPRESRIVRAARGSEDAGGASPEAQWQGPAGTSGFRWQDPGADRATRPGGGR